MDFSPYQRQSYRRRSGKKNHYILFLLSGLFGFFVFWGIKSLFFVEPGQLSSLVYQENSSGAEIKISEGESWTDLGDNMLVTNGDSIRSKKGNTGVLSFENNSTLQLGLGSAIKIGEVRKNEDETLFGSITLEKGPILLTLNNSFDIKQKFKIWISNDIYVEANEGVLFFDTTGISVIKGGPFEIRQIDGSEKIRNQKSIGIAQHLSIREFSLTGLPETTKSNILVEEYFPKTTTLLETIIPQEVSVDLNAPQITSPASTDEVINITKTPQLIEGTAPEMTDKILVLFSDEKGNTDEYVLKNFSQGDKQWKYVASPQYDNLSEGRNTYKIYSEDKNGKRSSPSILIMDYTPEDSGQRIFSPSKGNLLITSPANGNNTIQSNPKIVLKGVAPSNASYVTVVNKTLGTEYTLKKFKKGDNTWSYLTGEMDDKTYNYLVKAQDSQKRTLSSDTIAITIKRVVKIDVVPSTETTPVVNTPTEEKTTQPIKSATTEVSR